MSKQEIERALGIRGVNTPRVVNDVIEFTDNESYLASKLKIYHSLPNQNGSFPMVLFSHGGTIEPDYLGSRYGKTYNLLVEFCSDAIICAPNHRTPLNAEPTSLDTRCADILLTIDHMRKMLENNDQSNLWNGKVVLIGHSAGGHVVASLAREIKADGVVLIQPAAFSARAHFAQWGTRGTENEFSRVIHIQGEHPIETSVALLGIAEWAKEIGPDQHAMIIDHIEDEVVVTNRGSRIPDLYREAMKLNGKLHDILVNGGHSAIDDSTAKKIADFVKRFV